LQIIEFYLILGAIAAGKSGSWRPFVADKPVGLAVEK
jgi:hypothetical protein